MRSTNKRWFNRFGIKNTSYPLAVSIRGKFYPPGLPLARLGSQPVYLLKLALTLAIIFWLVYYLHTHEILATLAQIKPTALGICLALALLNLALQFWKWHLLLCSTYPALSARTSLFSLFAGFPLGLITPGRWGELGRALFITEIEKAEVVVLAAIDKLYNFFVTCLAGTCALLYFSSLKLLPAFAAHWLWLLFVLSLALNIVSLHPKWLLRLADLPHRFWPGRFLPLHANAKFSLRTLAGVWLISFLFVMTFCVQFFILLHGFTEIFWQQSLAGAAATFFIKSALPVTIGDLGVREGVAVYVFSRLGVAPAFAFNASLVLFIINLVLPSLVGLHLIWRRRRYARPEPRAATTA